MRVSMSRWHYERNMCQVNVVEKKNVLIGNQKHRLATRNVLNGEDVILCIASAQTDAH